MENKNIQQGLWAATATSKPQLDSIKGNQKTDIAIIGGGYTGLSAALHLSKMGRENIVLEAQDIGHGGAGRNVGLVNAGLWLMPEDLLRLAGPEYGKKLIDVLGNSPDMVFDLIKEHDIDCEALRNGTLHCADSKKGLKALGQREEQWKKLGAPVQLLSKEDTALKTGSDSFYGALLDNRAGTIQPLSYAHGLANAALKAGSQIFKQSPVIAIDKSKGEFKLKTPTGTLTAKSVIIAVPAYPDHVYKSNQKSLVQMSFFQFATQPLSKDILKTVLPGHQGAWDTNLILSSYRLDAAGRLIVGSVGTVNDFAYGLHESWVNRTIAKTFPQIEEIKLEYGWHGKFAMNNTHIPRFHVPDKNMAMISSYNGRGIGPGTVFGKLLAQYITTGSVDGIPLPITKLAPIHTRKFWELFYETGSRLYHFIQRRI
jgi:glycine/D-amino acid oxidase-like deaminating enzyme